MNHNLINQTLAITVDAFEAFADPESEWFTGSDRNHAEFVFRSVSEGMTVQQAISKHSSGIRTHHAVALENNLRCYLLPDRVDMLRCAAGDNGIEMVSA